MCVRGVYACARVCGCVCMRVHLRVHVFHFCRDMCSCDFSSSRMWLLLRSQHRLVSYAVFSGRSFAVSTVMDLANSTFFKLSLQSLDGAGWSADDGVQVSCVQVMPLNISERIVPGMMLVVITAVVYLSFHPMAKKNICMHAKAWLARLPPPASRMRRSRRLRDTLAAAPGLLAHASVTTTVKFSPMGPQLRYIAPALLCGADE